MIDQEKIYDPIVKKLLCWEIKVASELDGVLERYIWVYVGKKILCKFNMDANDLNHPLFENLLQIFSEECGYSYDEALRIAYEVDMFQNLLQLLKSNNPFAHYMQLFDLIFDFHDTIAS